MVCSPPSSPRPVAAVHQGGAGPAGTAGEHRQASLESHEGAGGGECGEICVQVHPLSGWTPLSTVRP